MVSASLRNLVLLLSLSALFDAFVAPSLPLDELYRAHILPFARHRMFEPVVSVLSFGGSAIFFSVLLYFRRYWCYAPNTTSSRARSSTNVSYDGDKMKQSHELEDYGFVRGDKTKWFTWVFLNVAVYLGLIEIFHRAVGYEKFYEFDEHFDGVFRLVVEVLLSFTAYDIIFGIIHRRMHDPSSPKWLRGIHLTHHDYYTPEAVSSPIATMTVFHHHIVDGSLQVMVNAAVNSLPILGLGRLPLLWGPFARHTLSKALHNFFVTRALCEEHCGSDLTTNGWNAAWMSHRFLFPEWCGHPLSHQRHHHTGQKPFVQFFGAALDWTNEVF